MAQIEPLANKIFKWEGGFSNDPVDRGGPTNKGITISTWKQVGYDKDGDKDIDTEDLLLMSSEDATRILRLFYWNRWRADEILNQSIAEILVDWVWCSGKWGIIIPQRILEVEDDGIVGRCTLAAVNQSDAKGLHVLIYKHRLDFIQRIIQRDPTQKRFERGWIRRLNDFTFTA